MKNKIIGAIIKIIIVAIMLFLVVAVLTIAEDYEETDITDRINLIINNNNVTSRLKEDVMIKDEEIYLSMKDIENFFDKYIYKEGNQIITTYNDNIANLEIGSRQVKINEENKQIKGNVIEDNKTYYLPMTDLKSVYDIEIEYIPETNIVTIDSIEKEQKKASINKDVSVKWKEKILSRDVEKLKKDDEVIVIDEDGEWTKVRAESGKIGYVKTENIANKRIVREEAKKEKQVDGKINMFWDYFSETAKAPNRQGEQIDGVNVVSPSFFYINADGEFKENVGERGIQYIKWAHENNYKVWPMVANSGSGMIDVTSEILNDYSKRHELIENIVNVCKLYELDGINVDFENMYQKDKDVFSRFIIELVPLMQQNNLVTSVDVTAPDGSETWSLCFDRTVIGDVADYIVFMAYDQYGTGSTRAGTTAGYNWVETSLNKFLKTYEVESEKIILGIPFYTRIWSETPDGKVTSKAVNIKDVDSVIPNNVERSWNEALKQDYVEYQDGNVTKKMWIEDVNSIKEKVLLVSKYDLAGVSAWEKDREPEELWQVIKDCLGVAD